tara:strand:- start:78 stop:197 length:120 start_codon:yes stop_codon:yes gene_type:complete
VGGKDSRTFINRAIDADKSQNEVDVFEEKFHYYKVKNEN